MRNGWVVNAEATAVVPTVPWQGAGRGGGGARVAAVCGRRGRGGAAAGPRGPTAGPRAAAGGGGPLDVLIRLLALLWMGLAHGVGWLVRAVGRRAADARDLDPEHRRDGGGLFVLGIAVLLAAGVWFGAGGAFGRYIALVLRLFVGRVAGALPVLLLIR